MGERLPDFETFEHTADVGLVARGGTLEELFVNAARGMFRVIAGEVRPKPLREVTVEVEAADREGLLVAWLNELLFRFAADGLLFGEFRVEEMSDRHLKGRAVGEPLSQIQAPLETELKAATYHDLRVERTPEGFWEARVLFDA